MKITRTFRRVFTLIAALSYLSPCLAAQDGYLRKSSSEGSIRISLAILPSLQISVVNQINVDITNVQVDSNFGEYVCITGQKGGRYQLIASGNNTDFVLNNTDGEALPYDVFYNGAPPGESFDQLVPGTPSIPYNLISDASQCASAPNFRITFRSQNLQDAPSGLYSGSLTLLVSPL